MASESPIILSHPAVVDIKEKITSGEQDYKVRKPPLAIQRINILRKEEITSEPDLCAMQQKRPSEAEATSDPNDHSPITCGTYRAREH